MATSISTDFLDALLDLVDEIGDDATLREFTPGSGFQVPGDPSSGPANPTVNDYIVKAVITPWNQEFMPDSLIEQGTHIAIVPTKDTLVTWDPFSLDSQFLDGTVLYEIGNANIVKIEGIPVVALLQIRK